MIPTDIISHIGNYIKYHNIRLLNKEINEKVILNQLSEEWFNLYCLYFSTNNIRLSKSRLIYSPINWKYEYLRVMDYKMWHLFGYDQLMESCIVWHPDKKIKYVPKEIGYFETLQEMYLYKNEIVRIPIEIGNLVNLQILYMNNNCFTCLPNEMGNLINLQVLLLHCNKIKQIPDTFENLINIWRFYIHDNLLITLPKEMSGMIKLDNFRATYNLITYIPEEIKQMTNFENFTFDK